MIFKYIACALLLLPFALPAQDRCATVVYDDLRHRQNPALETEDGFEQWIARKILERKQRTFSANRIQSTPYIIPVVVHVIHNNEAIGTGTNISDAQINSQISVLNKDFRRLNADAGSTPAEFLGVAGSLEIQFVLASQDPEGLATNGITRTPGTQTQWALADNNSLKELSYWPAEDYLNIWVVNMESPYIGYAQLPVSGTLDGLDNSSFDRLTDGVVIHYRAFGSINDGAFNLDPAFNKGRTTTHEVGHFFGLRHIWGDKSGCATDYVDDTPSQNSATAGCPSHPQVSCSHNKMFQNYMDYSNDACMNLFTAGQFMRSVIVIENSPRRASLLTSHGTAAPTTVANDLGLRRIVTPNQVTCSNPYTPQLEIRNYGSNTISSAQINVSIDGGVVETKTFSSLGLASLQMTTVNFAAIAFTPGTSHTLDFTIVQTNGTTDGNPFSNTISLNVSSPTGTTLPISETFNSMPSGWTVDNPDQLTTWVNGSAPDSSPTNRAMTINLNSYENYGTRDWLVTPFFPVPTPLSTQLKFDVAYAQYPGEDGDALRVYALPACSRDLSQAILLYDKSGAALATASSRSSSFVPGSENDWRRGEAASLGGLSAGTPWQLAFVSVNGYGNNIYIDNVSINDQVVNDIALTGIESPGIVSCNANPVVRFTVKNFTGAVINTFGVSRRLNNGTAVVQNFSGVGLAAYEQRTFNLDAFALPEGTNKVHLGLQNPNGFPDSAPANDTLTLVSRLDRSQDVSPLRVTFDQSFEIPWIPMSYPGAETWATSATNKGSSAIYPAFTNTNVGEDAWLVSPVLDLSDQSTGSMFFDISYRVRSPGNERLRVLASKDCGYTYPIVLLDRQGSQFDSTPLSTSWVPSSDGDWTHPFINLDTLAGSSLARIAFVVTNQNGNNLYLDNIELFVGNDPAPPLATPPYQLYYTDQVSQAQLGLSFYLTQRNDVHLQIYSSMGQLVTDNLLPDVLNQTYYFDLSSQAAGIYIFRLQIGQEFHTSKVFLTH